DVPVRGRAQERPELLAEEVLEIEAEADRAPPEERVLLRRHLEEEREFVPAEVERADVDSLVWERLGDLAVGLVLLLLLGLRAAPDDEELGAEEADAHRAVRAGNADLARKVDVGAQEDGLAIRSDGLEVREEDQLLLPLAYADVALAVDALLQLRGLDDHPPGPGVQHQLLAVLDDARDVAEADDGGQADRAGEDGRVGGAAAGVGRDAENLVPVEPHGERRREVARDQHDRLLHTGEREVRLGPSEQVVRHPELDVEQVVQPPDHQGVAAAPPGRLELEHAELEGARGREMVLPDVGDRGLDEVHVVQHDDLRIEDLRLDLTQPLRHVLPDLADAGLRPFAGRVEPLDLGLDVRFGDRRPRHARDLPVQHEGGPDDDAG